MPLQLASTLSSRSVSRLSFQSDLESFPLTTVPPPRTADIAFMLSQAAGKGPGNLRIFDELAMPPTSRTASPAPK